jgi:phage repressor protein C with HTH and peptisase S24 domain
MKLKTQMGAMTIGERIKAVRGPISQEEFSKDLGIHKNTLGKYERGERVPDAEFLNSLLRSFTEVDPAWLLTGEGAKIRRPDVSVVDKQGIYYAVEAKAPSIEQLQARRKGDRYCYIPLYDVKASAGGGAVVDRENVVDFLSFKAEWIQMQLNASPGDLYLIHVEGESMEPTLRPGDVILIDHREASALPRDGIYVVRMDDTLLVKRLQRLPGAQARVTSDNPAYQPFTVSLAQERNEMEIVGRVVWCGRRM